MKLKYLQFVAVLALGACLNGCVSSTQVGVFSQAASQAATDLQNGFEQVQETTVSRKISDLASDTNTPSDDTFAGVLDEQRQLPPRLEFLAKLKIYADSLGTLATADNRKDVDAASKDLYGALDGLVQTYKATTAKDLPYSAAGSAIIATAVDGIGNAIVEYKRQAALRKIVQETDPAIQAVAQDLEKTFGDLTRDHFIYQNLNSVVADMTSSYNLRTARWNYDERLSYLGKIRQARQIRDSSEAFIAAAARSAKALARAHKALANSARLGKLTGPEIVQGIQQLASEAAKAKEFYDQIHSKI